MPPPAIDDSKASSASVFASPLVSKVNEKQKEAVDIISNQLKPIVPDVSSSLLVSKVNEKQKDEVDKVKVALVNKDDQKQEAGNKPDPKPEPSGKWQVIGSGKNIWIPNTPFVYRYKPTDPKRLEAGSSNVINTYEVGIGTDGLWIKNTDGKWYTDNQRFSNAPYQLAEFKKYLTTNDEILMNPVFTEDIKNKIKTEVEKPSGKVAKRKPLFKQMTLKKVLE
jgi:hypothetical protein